MAIGRKKSFGWVGSWHGLSVLRRLKGGEVVGVVLVWMLWYMESDVGLMMGIKECSWWL